MNGQLKPRERHEGVRKMHPTAREVLLARLLLHVCDELWSNGYPTEDVGNLYNEIKSIAEGVIHAAS